MSWTARGFEVKRSSALEIVESFRLNFI